MENILFLDVNPILAARNHNDLECSRRIVTYCKFLSYSHHTNPHENNYDLIKEELCRPFSLKIQKQSSKTIDWLNSNLCNYLWLLTVTVELSKEYMRRNKKLHKYQGKISILSTYIPKTLLDKPAVTMFPLDISSKFLVSNTNKVDSTYFVDFTGKLVSKIENPEIQFDVIESYKNYQNFLNSSNPKQHSVLAAVKSKQKPKNLKK